MVELSLRPVALMAVTTAILAPDKLSMTWLKTDWTIPGPMVRVGSLYSSMEAWPAGLAYWAEKSAGMMMAAPAFWQGGFDVIADLIHELAELDSAA